jgi:toxin ParE1/3/4
VKPIIIRAQADEDIDRAIERFRVEFPLHVEQLVDAFEATLRRIARFPAAGSPRYAIELGIDGLRSMTTGRFPCIVFYVETSHEVAIVRVLHKKRDMPPLLED